MNLTPNPPTKTAAKTLEAGRDGSRSRFSQLPIGGLEIGPRDRDLLFAVFLNQTLTRGQIQTLFFFSVSRCNARLRQLFDWGYLARATLPTAPFGAQALYMAGKAAVPLLTQQLAAADIQAEMADIRAQCLRPALSLLEHSLAVADVYVAVQKALEARPGVRLEHWLPERFCCHAYELRRTDGSGSGSPGRWHKEVFRPDAFLRLTAARAGELASANYFLELDRGHTNSRQFLGKLRTHARFLESGLFRDSYGWDRFQTLVVTTGRDRARNLRKLSEQEGSGLFWFTPAEAVQKDGILASIWHVPGHSDPVPLI